MVTVFGGENDQPKVFNIYKSLKKLFFLKNTYDNIVIISIVLKYIKLRFLNTCKFLAPLTKIQRVNAGTH